MKLIFDYEGLLIRQCKTAFSAFEGKSTDSTLSIFSEICRHLTKDFLPPIDREDIAALSYSIFDICTKCISYSRLPKGKNADFKIKKQLDLMPCIISGLLNKKKTCGEDIRRFIAVNNEFSAASSEIDDALKDFIKTANSAFYKNL